MRKGIATPEKNLAKSLTIPVKTRSPIEAFRMLQAGRPVDVMLAYYQDQNGADQDLFMMDKVEKLHAIRRYKEMAETAKNAYEADLAQYNAEAAAIKAAKDAEAKSQRDQIISDYINTNSNVEDKKSA